MNKNTIYLGIDISKAVFDVFISSGEFINLKTTKLDSSSFKTLE